jgi:hypothetical protein
VTWISYALALLLTLDGLSAQKVQAASGDSAGVERLSSLGLYSYVRDTLNTFEKTGRLEPNPGIDGADIEAFIALLERSLAMFDAIESGKCARFERLSGMTKESIEQEFGTRVAGIILLVSQERSPPSCE